MVDSNNISPYAKKITTNRIFQASLVVLGAAFTVSTIVNNYYAIRWNKMRTKMEQGKAGQDNNQ